MLHNIANRHGLLDDTTGWEDEISDGEDSDENSDEDSDDEVPGTQGLSEAHRITRGKAARLHLANTAF